MKGLKKLLSLVLAVAMVATLAPAVPSKAAGEMEGQIVVLHTNDVHGSIENYPKIAQLKKDYEAKGAFVLLVDAGDNIMGTANVTDNKGLNAVKIMNTAGYDAATLGNHELDFGMENLLNLYKEMKYSLLVSTISKDGNKVFDANKVFTSASGVKVGVFGMNTPETQTKTDPSKSAGYTFAVGEELAKIAKEQTKALKDAGCEIVICLAHLGIDEESVGNRSIDVLKGIEGLDLVIDGHSHSDLEDMQTATKEAGITGTVFTSTGTKLENIGVVIFSKADSGYKVDTALLVSDDYEGEDAATKALVDEIIKDVDEKYDQKFGVSEVDLDGEKANVRSKETNLSNLITDAIGWAAAEKGVSVDGVITNGGGIRASIKAGDITKKMVKAALPFDNYLVVLDIKGSDLLEVLEASTFALPESLGGFPQVKGIVYSVNTNIAYDAGENYPGSTYAKPKSIKRVTISTVNGQKFDPNKVYKIAVNDFMANGGDTYYIFKNAVKRTDYNDVQLYDALMDYVEKGLNGVISKEMYGGVRGELGVSGTVTTTPAPGPAVSGQYVVVKGDSLWKIAKKQYNDGNKYKVIYNANKDTIKNPNMIKVGQVLTIPAVA